MRARRRTSGISTQRIRRGGTMTVSARQLARAAASPNHLSEANDGSVGWDGLSVYNFTTDAAGNQTMTDSTDYLNAAFTQNYTAGQIQSVAAHELGHVAGLGHTTGCNLMVGDTFTR